MKESHGHWGVPLFEYQPMWDINYSDILTELIQYAGRYCESYASDLFIIWKYSVEQKLMDRELESYTLTLGFRDMGVDHELSNDPERQPVTNNSKNNSYYYRKIATLTVNVEGSKIQMTLD